MKGPASAALYSCAVVIAFYSPAAAGAIYTAVVILWLVPDTRIERVLRRQPSPATAETDVGSA